MLDDVGAPSGPPDASPVERERGLISDSDISPAFDAPVDDPVDEGPRPSRPASYWIERAIGVAVLVAVAAYILSQLQLHLLLRDTTPNGGDTGAHVWWPAYMRDHVFSKLQLSGWAPDWYAGFPAGHFYFPLPALFIVLLDLALPYNIAFKLVTAMGPVLLPAGAYVFARGLKVPWPGPPLFAIATLPFLFFTPGAPHEHNFRIMGGNLPSTLAGEFSYAIALALALFFLGTLAMALDQRRRLWLPALLLAMTVMTHGIVTVFAAVGALVIWLAHGAVRRVYIAVAIGAVAFLISAIWTLPVLGRVAYMTDMGWTKVTFYKTYLLPDDMRWAIVLAGVALIIGAAFLRRATLELAALAVLFALLFWQMPDGRLWNLRLLPFYHLSIFFLAALGVTELVNLGRRLVESPGARHVLAGGSPPGQRESGDLPDGDLPDGDLPDGDLRDGDLRDGEPMGSWLDPDRVRVSLVIGHAVVAVALVAMVLFVNGPGQKEFIPSWARWNNEGYEDPNKPFAEYDAIMQTLDSLPVPYGTRLTWERLASINNYGSDLALELIPYFTDGKIGSMEGLYFESAGTTPYHFLTVADIATEPSNPVQGLPYGNINENFDRGVARLQLLGVRFYMAGSDTAKQKACGITDGRTLEQHLKDGGLCTRDDLNFVTLVGDIGATPLVTRWAIFEVQDAHLVEPLAFEPVVLSDVSAHDWRVARGEGASIEWFDDSANWTRFWAADGPAAWERVNAERAPFEPIGSRYPEVKVTDVEMGDDHVRFKVDKTGVPVLVKVSYFPNWQVRGADGPWRITPNFMVVVPTDNEVELHYGRTPIDRFGIALSLVGIAGLVGLVRYRPRRDEDGPDGNGPDGKGSDGNGEHTRRAVAS